MMDDVAEVVYKTLLSVIERWEELAGFFDELLCEKRALLDPAHHDSLLTDDGSFSRSKRYFWAIEFLKEAEKGVGDNVKQTRGFLETLRAVPPLVRAGRREYQGRVKRVEGVLGRLEGLRGRFSSIKNEAIDLRDGVCFGSLNGSRKTRNDVSCLTNNQTHSFSTQAPLWRVEPRQSWQKISSCLPLSASSFYPYHFAL